MLELFSFAPNGQHVKACDTLLLAIELVALPRSDSSLASSVQTRTTLKRGIVVACIESLNDVRKMPSSFL